MTGKTNLKCITINVRGLRNNEKRNKVFEWLKKKKYDIIFLQETFLTKELETKLSKEWNGESVHNFSDSKHSRGVSILFGSKLSIELVNVHRSADSRKLLLNVKLFDRVFCLFNLYAPNHNNLKKEFFNRMCTWINNYAQDANHLLVSGDMNTNENDAGWKYFLKCKEMHKLSDVWDKVNPNSPCNTWVDPANSLHQTRLDYALTSGYLSNYIVSSTIEYAPTPDHNALVTCFSIKRSLRGPSYWKLNISILNENDYNVLIKKIVAETIDEYSMILCKRKLWDFIKVRIKEGTIKYCMARQQRKVCDVMHIEKQMKIIDSNIGILKDNVNKLKEERNELKLKLDLLYHEKAKAAQIRSRAKWVEDGEKSTSYFLKLEQKHQTFNNIDRLQANGIIIEDNKQILEECALYYEKLYTAKDPCEKNINKYVADTCIERTLNEDEKSLCEGLVSVGECFTAIQKMKLNKSPGIDGLPTEFYICFWDTVKHLVVDSFNEGFIHENLSDSQNSAVLSLIFKKNDRLLLKYYRPISLTTADYKILAFTLANRLHKVIEKIVSIDQSAYIKKRFIGQNIRLVEDIIEHVEKFEQEGLVLFLDFEKAFDSIEWKFIVACLEKFNFGTEFITWIRTIYNSPTAIIKNNGWLSRKIEIFRGIKQGCPLSALLFIIATELLSQNLKNSTRFRGLGIHNKEIRIIQYADDTIIFLQSESDIEMVVSLINDFSKVAGLNLNLNKTEGLLLGKLKNKVNVNKKIQWKTAIRCLGIYVGTDKGLCYKHNWLDKLIEMQKLLDSWRTRDLTLFGKALIIKSLAISKIVYTVMNTSVPEDAVAKIDTMLFKFLWPKKSRIKRNIMIAPTTLGGINMIDTDSFFDSIKASWVQKIISGRTCTWATIGEKLLKNYPVLESTATDIKQYPFFKTLPDFYKQVIVAYNKCKEIEQPNSLTLLKNQAIWGNKFLQIYNKKEKHLQCLYMENWISSGIMYIGNLPIKNGQVDICNIMTMLKNKTNVLIEAKQIQLALKPFKNVLNCVDSDPSNFENPAVEVMNKTVSNNYAYLVSKKYQSVKLKELSSTFCKEFSRTDIENICKKKIIEIGEKKISEFNYKIIHSILPCGYILSKWCDDRKQLCDVCDVNETIVHLIWECKLAQTLWKRVSTVLRTEITKEDIFLGTNRDSTTNYAISVVSYNLYKYRQMSWNNDFIRSSNGLLQNLIMDIKFRHQVYQKLSQSNITKILHSMMSLLSNITS